MQTKKSATLPELNAFFSPTHAFYFSEEEWDTSNRELKVYSQSLEDESVDSFLLSIPDTIPIQYLPDICMNKNYLVLTDDSYFEHYRYRKEGESYRLTSKIKLPAHSTGRRVRYITDDLFLFYSIYNQHPADEVFNANLGIYDAAKDSMLAFIHPDLPCIGLTHFRGNLVAASEKEIAVAHPCGYSLDVYDLQLLKISSIRNHPATGWRDLPHDSIPMETRPDKIHPKALIDRLFLMNDTVSRIQNIFYTESRELIVIASAIQSGEAYNRIDLWDTNNPSKPLLESPQVRTDLDEPDAVSLRNYPLYLNRPIQIEMFDNTMFAVYDMNFLPKHGQTIKDYKQEEEIYYEKADPFFSIGIFEVVLP